MNREPLYVIPDGGDVRLKEDPSNVKPAERIEILPGGWVKLIFKRTYSKQFVTRDDIASISSHTQTEEAEDWWSV